MQTVSVRIPEDDLAWLASSGPGDATSPSDKIRALIADARRRAAGSRDYVGCAALLREQLRPFTDTVQALEYAEKTHSEVLALLAAQLPELMAELIAAAPLEDLEAARDCEARLTIRAMRLLLGLLRLAVTQRVPAYDNSVFEPYLSEVAELTRLMQTARQKQGD